MFKKAVLFLIVLTELAFAAEVNFQDANVMDVIEALARQAGFDIVVSGDANIAKKVSMRLEASDPEEALEYVLRANGFTMEKKGKVILVSTLSQDIQNTAYPGVSRTFNLKNLSADKVAAILAKILPSVSAVCGSRASELVIRGKEAELNEIESLLRGIDRPVPQILIESKVIEIAASDSIRLGFDHNSGVFKFVNGKKAEDIYSTLNAMLGSGQANLVASPRIATLDNHEAVINIGSRIPYAVPVSSNSAATQWTVDYIDAGVKLKITPQLGEGSSITTFIQPEVSSISEWRATAAGEFPVIATRNASATVRVKNGETIVVGGLIMDVDRVNVTRTPFLGQFPILNLFFQNRSVEKEKTEMVFMIKPYLI